MTTASNAGCSKTTVCAKSSVNDTCFTTPSGCTYLGKKVITVTGDGCSPSDSVVSLTYMDGTPAPAGSVEAYPCEDAISTTLCAPQLVTLPPICALVDGIMRTVVPVSTVLNSVTLSTFHLNTDGSSVTGTVAPLEDTSCQAPYIADHCGLEEAAAFVTHADGTVTWMPTVAAFTEYLIRVPTGCRLLVEHSATTEGALRLTAGANSPRQFSSSFQRNITGLKLTGSAACMKKVYIQVKRG